MANEIRGVLVPTKDVKVLFPNTLVAEVIAYEEPVKFENSPDWLLGKVHWRGWNIPLVSYSGMVHGEVEELGPQTRIAVIKGIHHTDELPYVAIINSGVPRLQTITQGDLQAHETTEQDHPAMAFRVTIHDELAEIPDMEEIETRVLHALKGAEESQNAEPAS
jgi:chemosensory pili system protein ChpC